MIQYQIYLGMKTKSLIIYREMIKDFVTSHVLNKYGNFTINEGYGYYKNIFEKVSIITILSGNNEFLEDNQNIKNIALEYKNIYQQDCVLITKINLIDNISV
jgi:hypothetical protein